MGYTHYMRIKKNSPPISDWALEEVRGICEHYKELIQYEFNDKKPPVITKNLIRFNGIGEQGHETFIIETPPNPQEKHEIEQLKEKGELFNFCKTARKPYDIVVCLCLLVLKADLKNNMSLSSDGFSSDDLCFDGVWNEALHKLRKRGYKIKTEINVREGTPYFDCKIKGVSPPLSVVMKND